MPERYLDPKNDLTFKRVFGEHPRVLKSFLNALLPLPEDAPIEELEYLPPELVPDIPILKNTIVDVRCRDTQGRVFLVEMQMLWTDSFMQRVLFNASKAYVKQIRRGDEYRYLQPVYSLNLVDAVFDRETDAYFHHYQIVNLADTAKQLEGLEFVFIELPKFRAETLAERKMHVLWLRYLTEISESSISIAEELRSVPEIQEALTYLRESAFDANELEAYDKYWDQVSVERTRLGDALRLGQRLGHEEGRQQGREEGRQQEREAIARRLFASGLSVESIATAMGLSVGEIQKIVAKPDDPR